MYIHELLWDEYRIEHIAIHEVEPEEVEEVSRDLHHIVHREGESRYRLYGQTFEGRYLLVILERIRGALFRPITSRDMTDREKQQFRRLRK